jgi:hypothetical protein
MEKVLMSGYRKAMETTAEDLRHYLSCDPDGRQIWCAETELVELDGDGRVLNRIKLPRLALGTEACSWEILSEEDDGSGGGNIAQLVAPKPVPSNAPLRVRAGGRSANVVVGTVLCYDDEDNDYHLGSYIGLVYAGTWEFELLEVRPGVEQHFEFSSDLRWVSFTVEMGDEKSLRRGRFFTGAPHIREEEWVRSGVYWIDFVSIHGAVAFSGKEGEDTGLFCWLASSTRIAKYEQQPDDCNYERCDFEERPETTFYVGDDSGNLYRVGTRGTLSCEKVAEWLFQTDDFKGVDDFLDTPDDFINMPLLCFRMMVDAELVPVKWWKVQEFSYHENKVLLVEKFGILTRLWALETTRPSKSLVHRCLNTLHTTLVAEGGTETQRILFAVETLLPDDHCRDILRRFERGRRLLLDYQV